MAILNKVYIKSYFLLNSRPIPFANSRTYSVNLTLVG